MTTARQQALLAGDEDAANQLNRLWLDYLEVSLPKRGRRLAGHLQTLAVWRADAGWPVIKTSQLPCIAFTYELVGKDVELIGLGACYRYPGNVEDQWWTGTIRPRVLQL